MFQIRKWFGVALRIERLDPHFVASGSKWGVACTCGICTRESAHGDARERVCWGLEPSAASPFVVYVTMLLWRRGCSWSDVTLDRYSIMYVALWAVTIAVTLRYGPCKVIL